MASNNPLQPTPIVDKNGVHSTRNKKFAQPQKALGIPMNPVLPRPEPVAVAEPVQVLSVSERLAKLEQIDAVEVRPSDAQLAWSNIRDAVATIKKNRALLDDEGSRAVGIFAHLQLEPDEAFLGNGRYERNGLHRETGTQYDSEGFDQWGRNRDSQTRAQVATARVPGTGNDVRAIAKDVEDALAEFASVTDWGVPVDAMETLIKASENPHADAATLESISGAIEWLDERNAHTPASQIDFNLSMNPSTFSATENANE
jgi:hypothetical protein